MHDDKPRGFWKLAKVQELITGRDGWVRGAIVKVHSGKNSAILRRPLQRLYPLEIGCYLDSDEHESQDVRDAHSHADQGEDVTTSHPTDQATETKRPTRAAALEARDRMKAWTIYNDYS